MKRVIRKVALGVLSLIVVLLIAGLTYQTLATRHDMNRLGDGGQFHIVNGKSLFIKCVGSARPTVVFEPGAGSWSAQWSHIQEQIAPIARVCTYDRAGLGLSEASRQSMSGADYVKDLHDLLQAAGEEPPYVLVGHSLGGFLARLYNVAYPSDLAGIVLADAAHEDQWTEFPPEINELMTGAIGQMRIAIWMSRFGVIRIMGIPRQGLPTEQQESSTQAIMMTTRYWRALLSEFEAGLLSLPDDVRGTPNLADLPLLVITAAKSANVYCATDGSAGVSCAEAQAVWDQLQAELVLLSSNSEQIILADATHAVYIDDPNALVRHISKFVQSISTNQVQSEP